MAVDSTSTGSGIDLNQLFQSAITGGNMGNIFGGGGKKLGKVRADSKDDVMYSAMETPVA